MFWFSFNSSIRSLLLPQMVIIHDILLISIGRRCKEWRSRYVVEILTINSKGSFTHLGLSLCLHMEGTNLSWFVSHNVLLVKESSASNCFNCLVPIVKGLRRFERLKLPTFYIFGWWHLLIFNQHTT